VIKKTGKFMPIEQWLHHDDQVLIGADGAGEFLGTRYAHLASVLGSDVMKKLQNYKVFMVGCGALGCEYMKGLALMGACTAGDGKLIVTDMDTIEVSNLSRQFLFRQPDVGSAKSTTAAKVVKGWNPALKVESLEKGVGVTSEDFFDDAFWSKNDICWNALDNVIARKYTDRCCLWYGLPLLESGTLGTKSNSDVFLPHLTKSYNDGTESDANENQIAMCTLRSFPFLPLHCIEFAKQAYFSDYLEFAPNQYEAFRKDSAGFFEQLDAMGEMEQLKALKMIKGFITTQKEGAASFNMCIKEAFAKYCADFVTSIKNMVHNYDEVEKTTGKPFWTGTKRRPVEAAWNPTNPPAEAMEYLYALANCFAFIWKISPIRKRGAFHAAVVEMGLQLPAWTPPGGEAKVDGEGDDEDKADVEEIEKLKGELYAVDAASLVQMEAHDFEKDDDTNFHIDFLTSSTNLRAANYNIKKSERAHVKVTAGRIIPALATTTAMICGLVDMEFLKIVKGLHKEENPLDLFYNANVNLATGSGAMNVFRPEAVIKKESKVAAMPEYTTWDKVEVAGEISMKELIEQISSKYKVTVKKLLPVGSETLVIFDEAEIRKLEWKIEITEEGAVVLEPEADVFTAWPQLKMAVQMLGKLPAGSGARTTFENQVRTAAKSLQGVKDNFSAAYTGPFSKAFAQKARPAEDEEKQKYFDAVFAKRPYIALQAHILNESGEECNLPSIKYNFR